jgi:hypothetical protein
MYLIVSWYSQEGDAETERADNDAELVIKLRAIADTSKKFRVFKSECDIEEIGAEVKP